MSIMPKEKFARLVEGFYAEYKALRKAHPDDTHLKKAQRTLSLINKCWGRDRVYAVKYLRHINRHMVRFAGARRSLFVKYTEVLQKLILEKKTRGGQ